MDDLVKMMEETGLPFAYDHFEEGEAPEPPFVCYLFPQSNHFSADGRVYLKITEVHIELYTDCKDLSAEQKVEAVLDKHGIFYEKSEAWFIGVGEEFSTHYLITLIAEGIVLDDL